MWNVNVGMVTLKFQHSGDCCAASLIGSEVTPTEDNYADGTTSTKKYMPRTCGVATVKILGESCRAVDGSTAPKWFKSRFADHCKHFLSSWVLQWCPRHCY